jgi:hypothetical protein
MRKKWKYTLARDIIALGGIPFLLITIIRVSVLELYYPMQFIISSIVFFLMRRMWKGSLHAGIGLILFVFISLFYESWLFFGFALALYIGLVFSLVYLRMHSVDISKGILFGAISSVVGYVSVLLIFMK